MSPQAMWPCDADGCVKPAVRTMGDCVLCDSHLCAKHASPEHHLCESKEDYNELLQIAEEKEILQLFTRINTSALLSVASKLRDGVPSFFQHPLEYDPCLIGGVNYHIEIDFEDGVCWMARIRRVKATAPPPDFRKYMMLSEVATLKFLSKTKVPVPHVFHYDFDPGNPVGVQYILMETIPGMPLDLSYATPEQHRKFIDQLADVYVELEKYPFDLMGSLDEPGTSHIGPFAREAWVDYVKSKMAPLGPMTSRKEFNVSSILLTMDLIMREEVMTDRPIDAFLINRFLLDCAQKISPGHDTEDTKFYLRHIDDGGQNIMVDHEFNITGIIDWDWAQTDTHSAAFKTPSLFLSMSQFHEGNYDLGEDEVHLAEAFERKGHPRLSQAVRNSRLIEFFELCGRYEFPDWEAFISMFDNLRKTVGIDGDLSWEEWKKKALKQWRNDHQLQELLSRHPNGRANRKV